MHTRQTPAALAEIARTHLGLDTLTPRGRDQLDFHSLGVANIRQALEAAYRAGRDSRQRKD